MLRKSTFLIILILSTCFSGRVWAAPSYLNSLASNPTSEIIKSWKEREESISLGKEKIALDQLRSLKDKMLLYNIRNAPNIAISILKEIDRVAQDLSSEEISGMTDMAVEIAPDISTVHFKAARIYFSPSSMNVKKGIDELSKALGLYLSDTDSRYVLFINLVYWALAALSVAIAIFIFISIVKYLLPLHHLLTHIFPKYFSPFSILVIIIAVPITGFLLLGPLSIILSTAFLFWIFYKPSEKVITALLLLLLTALPFLFYLPSFPVNYQGSTERQLLKTRLSPDYASNIRILEEILKKNPQDSEAKLILALLNKNLGNLRTSIDLLNEIIKSKPGWDKPLVNLGNIEYINGRFNSAIAYYNRASSANEGNFLAKYNLGKALYKVTRIEEANQALNSATNIDSKKFKLYEDISDPKIPVKYVFDEEITRRDLAERIRALQKPDKRIRNNLWYRSRLFNSKPETLSIISLIFIFFLIILSKFQGRIIPPRTCEMCGSAFCKRCSQVSNYRDICSPCHYIFVIKEGTDEEFKAKKEKEEARHKFFTNIFKSYSSFLIPGFGHLYSGRTATGLFFIFLFLWIIARLFLPDGLIADPYSVSLKGPSFITIVLLVAALLVYITANLSKKKGK